MTFKEITQLLLGRADCIKLHWLNCCAATHKQHNIQYFCNSNEN